MKYIDAERLKAKLDEHYRKYQSKYMETRTPYTQGLIDALDLAEQVIDSLQQEQQEVDLEAEVRNYCNSSFKFDYDELNDSFYSNAFGFDDVVELARHFAEWGAEHAIE